MDMLKTRHREKVLLEAFLRAKQSFVVDNTNATKAQREIYIGPAKAAKFRVIGYYFESRVALAVERDKQRSRSIGERGILGMAGSLERPTNNEGFDELFYVRIGEDGFLVEPWNEEQ